MRELAIVAGGLACRTCCAGGQRYLREQPRGVSLGCRFVGSCAYRDCGWRVQCRSRARVVVRCDSDAGTDPRYAHQEDEREHYAGHTRTLGGSSRGVAPKQRRRGSGSPEERCQPAFVARFHGV